MMNPLILVAAIAGSFLVLNTSKSKKSQKVNEKPPVPSNEKDFNSEGYSFKSCNVHVDDFFKSLDFARKIGLESKPDEWFAKIFGECDEESLFYSQNTANFSFEMIKSAARGGIESGQLSIEYANKLISDFKFAAEEAGVDTNSWQVSLYG